MQMQKQKKILDKIATIKDLVKCIEDYDQCRVSLYFNDTIPINFDEFNINEGKEVIILSDLYQKNNGTSLKIIINKSDIIPESMCVYKGDVTFFIKTGLNSTMKLTFAYDKEDHE